jgi:ABC-type multidrug transport system fused ATPase/permease subunit
MSALVLTVLVLERIAIARALLRDPKVLLLDEVSVSRT